MQLYGKNAVKIIDYIGKRQSNLIRDAESGCSAFFVYFWMVCGRLREENEEGAYR